MEKSLPIWFVTACCEHAQEPICRPEGSRVFHQLMVVVSGKGQLECRGQVYKLRPGCAFFTAKGVPVAYHSTDALVTAFLTADGPAVEQLMAFYGCDGFLFRQGSGKYVEDMGRVIAACRKHSPSGMLSALTYGIYADFFQQDQLAPLDQVVRYMEDHFMAKLTLKQLADRGNMSVSKLCHDFKRKYGLSVFAHILNLRLSYARTLLTSDASQTIKEVASSCGFEDVSYFCRAYKAKFGHSPSKERSA